MTNGVPDVPLMTLLDAARAAVLRAAEVCRLVQASLDQVRAITKDDSSPVTVADFAAQAVVAATLRERLGEFGLIAEESSAFLRDPAHTSHLDAALLAARHVWTGVDAAGMLDAIDLGSERGRGGVWTLDPIDGTKGFLRGQQYSVCLAYIVGRDPVVSALGCPNLPGDFESSLQARDARGSLYLSVKSEGGGDVWRTDCTGAEARRDLSTAVSEANRMRRAARGGSPGAVLVESIEPSHARQEATAAIMQHLAGNEGGRATAAHEAATVRIDSQCKYALVARGQADVYVRLPSKRGYVEKIWDHASGALIASEAGCTVSDARGEALDFSCGDELARNRGIVVAPPALHAGVIASIEALGLSHESPSR